MENYNTNGNHGGCRSCSCGGTVQTLTCCYNAVLAIIGALLAFAVGLIVGLTAFETLTTYFTAIVAIAIVLAVMFVAFLVLRFCKSRNDRC